MAINSVEREKIVEKYSPYLTRKGKGKGGIFTTITRGNLLGVPVKGRKRREKNYDFWYDVRSQVKNALVDLELFIETAGDKNVNEVLTPEALEPIVRSLLSRPVWRNAEPDVARAEIARLFIRAGFEYIQQMQKEHVTGLYKRAIDDGLSACNYLVELFRHPNERRLISALDLPGR